MIELIWAILNLAAVIGVIIFCVKKAIEIRQKVGLFVAIVFSYFALSFISRPGQNKEDKNFKFENKETTTQKLHQNTYMSDITLEDNIMSKFSLITVYNDENALRASISKTGYTFGTDWNTDYININKTSRKNVYQYEIIGTRNWHILGINVYSESKEFKGVKEFKPLH